MIGAAIVVFAPGQYNSVIFEILARPSRRREAGKMATPELRRARVHYPETDGKPMAESDLHRDLMLELIATLGHQFRDDRNFYVSGNLLIYFEKGNPEMSVSPDLFVVRGVPKKQRKIYKTWEEKGPELTLELTSKSTHLEDLGKKRAVYERLKVKEYFIFDPEGVHFQPRFRAFKLKDGILQPVSEFRTIAGAQVFSSKVVGLDLYARGTSLRWVDPRTGEPLLVPAELYDRIEAEKKRAEAETKRAEVEKEHAEAEKRRADAAEAELTRLREEISRLRRK